MPGPQSASYTPVVSGMAEQNKQAMSMLISILPVPSPPSKMRFCGSYGVHRLSCGGTCQKDRADELAGWRLFVLSHNCGGGGDLGISRIQHEPYGLSHFEAPRAGEMFCEECGCSQEQNGG